MKKFFKYLFHEADPIPHLIKDDRSTILSNVIGDWGIFVFFVIFAISCYILVNTFTPKEAYNQRRILAYLLGTAILFSGLSRGLNVLAMWHNYYFLNGIFKDISAFFAVCTLAYIPYLIRAVKNFRQLADIKETMLETSKKVDELKNISKKVLEKENNND